MGDDPRRARLREGIQEVSYRDDAPRHYRVVFRNHMLELLAIDVWQLEDITLDMAAVKARRQLEKEVDCVEDWECVSTGKLEHCGRCGRLHELALVHNCPTG